VFQTSQQYSKIGLTYTLKAGVSKTRFLVSKHRSIKFASLFISIAAHVICAVKLKL